MSSKVVIVGAAWPFRGGLTNYNERLARQFANAGYETLVYTFTLQYPGFLFPGKTQYSSSPAPEDLAIRRKVNSINPFNWFKTGNEIRNEEPDLLIIKFWLPFMGPCFGTIARRAKKNGKTRVISILDNVIPHEKRPGDQLFTNYFFKAVDGFIAMSDSVMNDLSLFDKHKPRLLSPHPIFDNFGAPVSREKALNQLNLPDDAHYILFFGIIRGYKGLDLILEAMAFQEVKNLPVKLIVAGEFYEDPAPYKKIIEDNALEDKVILTESFIPDEQVANYFCAADLVVQPYKNATQSGVTQIAYHFEKPMIVTDVGGLPEIVPHEKAGFVTGIDATAIAREIKRFFNENRKEKLEEGVREEKKKYSWERLVENIESVYQQCK